MSEVSTFSGSIGNGSTESLEVSSDEYVYLTIDDGTNGNNPATYDLVVEKKTQELGGENRYQYVLDETGRTDRSWRFECIGPKMRFKITNQSGSSANYDIEVEAEGE